MVTPSVSYRFPILAISTWWSSETFIPFETWDAWQSWWARRALTAHILGENTEKHISNRLQALSRPYGHPL